MRAWGVALLWAGVFLYYAHYDYLGWLPALGGAAMVLGVSGGIWGLFCGLYRSVEKGSVAYVLSSFLAFLGVVLFQKMLPDSFTPLSSWQEVMGYTCAIGVGVGGGIWAVSRVPRTALLRFFHFFSMGLFLLNGIGWPLYRVLKRGSKTDPVCMNPSSPLRSVYVILLDEHPSPAVLKQVFPQADTLLFRLGKRGFFYNDSLWANPASTLHAVAKVYQVTKGIEKDSIVDFGFLQDAGLLLEAQKKGYDLKGLWPYYGPLQQLPIRWEGNGLFSSAFGHFPWTRPISRWIKHQYDKTFVDRMKKIAGRPPEKPTFYHLHVFLTHAPYSTGQGGAWQPLLDYSLQERVRNAISYTHQVLLEFIDTLLATYRKAHRLEPIILVFSDHGWHIGEPERLGVGDFTLGRRLKHQAFLAAYLPGWDSVAARAAVGAVRDYQALSKLLRQALGAQGVDSCKAAEKLPLPSCGYM